MEEKQIVEWLLEKTDSLLIDDSSDFRDEIAEYCADIFNDNYEDYKKLRPELMEIIDEMAGMDEAPDGTFEPKIIHMGLQEIEELSKEIKKII